MSFGSGAVQAVPTSAPLTTGKGSRDDDPRALQLLHRAAASAEKVTFSGTQLIGSWMPSGTAAYVLDVEHSPLTGTTVHEHGTGSSQEAARWAPTRDPGAPSSLSVEPLAVLAESFTVSVAGSGSVAGRTSTIVEARRDDNVAARLWIDDQSALLLRKEVLDEQGRLVRESAFLELTVQTMPGVPQEGAQQEGLLARNAVDNREENHERLDADALDRLRQQGWACPEDLPRGLTLYAAQRMSSPTGEVVHLSYSDGISSVSVFEQPGRLDVDGLEGYEVVQLGTSTVHARSGMPISVVWESDRSVLTVVADAPASTVADVVTALPHAEPTEKGIMARLGRGIDRAAAALAGQ
jgi:sigma-E factor negative regulatory protein RseB